MAEYFNGLLIKCGINLPSFMTGITVFGIPNCQIEGPIFVITLTLILTRGMSESDAFNLFMTTLKLGTLVFIIMLAFANWDTSNYEPFILEEEGGWAGTILAASIIFYGYLGFDVITTLSPDAARPEKDVARAVKFSTILCILLYILTAVSLAGMARMQDFSAETAMAEAFDFIGI